MELANNTTPKQKLFGNDSAKTCSRFCLFTSILSNLVLGNFWHTVYIQISCEAIYSSIYYCIDYFSPRDRKNSCEKRLHSKEQWEANNNPKSQLNLHMTTIYQRNCSSNSPITHDVYNIQELMFFLIPCNETI
jgi:hypothetical protein